MREREAGGLSQQERARLDLLNKASASSDCGIWPVWCSCSHDLLRWTEVCKAVYKAYDVASVWLVAMLRLQRRKVDHNEAYRGIYLVLNRFHRARPPLSRRHVVSAFQPAFVKAESLKVVPFMRG